MNALPLSPAGMCTVVRYTCTVVGVVPSRDTLCGGRRSRQCYPLCSGGSGAARCMSIAQLVVQFTAIQYTVHVGCTLLGLGNDRAAIRKSQCRTARTCDVAFDLRAGEFCR